MRSSQSIGWLVRLILEVIYDMASFMLVFSFTILAFADAFYTLADREGGSEGDGSEGGDSGLVITSFWNSLTYTYLLTLGEFGDLPNHFSIRWVFFITCSLFNLIIILNLLIAIISETHARVTEISELLLHQEIASLISDFLYFDKDTDEADL